MTAICMDDIVWTDRYGRRVRLGYREGSLTATLWRRSWRDWVVWATGKSQYLISKLLNQLFNATAYSFPATVYMALWTSALAAASTGATAGEAAYTGYTRVAMTANNTNFSTSSAGTATTNSVAVTFPAAGSGPTTVTYFAILDTATLGAGNILYWGSITSTVIANGDTPQVNASALSVTET